VRGHFDDLEDEVDDAVRMLLPTSEAVVDAAAGWGHSAVIVTGGVNNNDQGTAQGEGTSQLFMTGRPHEFASLLRLRRLPRWLRNYSSRQTLRSTAASVDDSSTSLRSMDPTSLVGRFVTYLSDTFLDQPEAHWDQAREHSFLPALTRIPLPEDDQAPVSVSCSAGLTAVLTRSGRLYTLGLNQYGQCGNGHTSNNVWTPQLVTGLSSEVATQGPRSDLPQSSPITQVSLGLQHGVCLNAEGEVFAFGKGDRGQLGQDVATAESHTAMAVRKACRLLEDKNNKPAYVAMPKVAHISTGMLHCALLTEDGEVFVFGKNMLRKSMSDDPRAPAADARFPVRVRGIPTGRSVLRVASGSHHTSMLLDDGSVWGIGISSDTKEPIHEPVQLVTKDDMEDMLPVRQFAAHMDRTTIVGRDGRTVLQVHLWSDPDLREYAVFTPAWIERLLLDDPDLAIQQVHRGWIHSLVVASKND
jgi:alpha-tubulin suppressor-like RCC1 family protein